MKKKLDLRKAAEEPASPLYPLLRRACGLSGCLRTTLKLALLASILVLSACRAAETVPAEINPEDMCSFCKMAISEKRFAAEFITKDGDAVKFDDLGCLQNYLKGHADGGRVAAYFVTDYESRKWIKGDAAHFVKSPEFATPMGGNIAAFQDPEKARTAVATFTGQQLAFADVFGK